MFPSHCKLSVALHNTIFLYKYATVWQMAAIHMVAAISVYHTRT